MQRKYIEHKEETTLSPFLQSQSERERMVRRLEMVRYMQMHWIVTHHRRVYFINDGSKCDGNRVKNKTGWHKFRLSDYVFPTHIMCYTPGAAPSVRMQRISRELHHKTTDQQITSMHLYHHSKQVHRWAWINFHKTTVKIEFGTEFCSTYTSWSN